MKRAATILFLAIATLCVCQGQQAIVPGRSWAFRQQAAAGGYFGGLVSTNDLVAAWRFDESSDGSAAVTRNDSWGANHLTDISTYSASVAGLITNAVDFELADTANYLNIADNAALSMPSGTSFTITCWFRPESVTQINPLISKGSGSGANTEYIIFSNSATDWRARIGDTSNQATVTNTVTPANETWFFVALRVDLAADLIKLRINTTDASVAYTGDTVDGSSAVNIGRTVYSSPTRADGDVEAMYIWKRVLTDDEITALYGGGAGLDLGSP